MDKVKLFLNDLNLTQFVSYFEDNGYDDINMILELDETEINYQNGKLAFIKDINLKIEKNNYKIGIVKLGGIAPTQILLRNIKTPKLDLKQISIAKKNKIFDLNFSGKKI